MLFIVLLCLLVVTWWRWGIRQAWKRQKPSYRLSAAGKTLRLYKTSFAGLRYVLAGPKIVSDLYNKNSRDPFAIPTCDLNYHVYVSSETHIRELNNASIYDLSFNAAMQEKFHHEYTIMGFRYDDDKDPNSSVAVRTLKGILRPQLPTFTEALQSVARQILQIEVTANPKKVDSGWSVCKITDLSKLLCKRMNNVTIVGQELGLNKDFIKLAARYVEDAALVGELLGMCPKFLKPLFGRLGMRISNADANLSRLIHQEITQRLAKTNSATKHKDCLQFLFEAARTPEQRDPLRITQQTMGFLFAAAHQLPMFLSFALYELSLRPKLVEALKQEAAGLDVTDIDSARDGAQLLDSFLREVARTHPLSAISIVRRTMKPLTLSDGLHVPVGNWIGIPQNGILGDESFYRNADCFQADRFVMSQDSPDSNQDGVRRFTFPDLSFPFWGSIKQSCPGRFYVSMVVKMVLITILSEYEIEPVDKDLQSTWTFGPHMLPSSSLSIRIRAVE
ncbi:cytochrome P450 [Venturia nashicola]|nr:cytochrome P450 [Venturia nashicola]